MGGLFFLSAAAIAFQFQPYFQAESCADGFLVDVGLRQLECVLNQLATRFATIRP